MKQIKLFVSTSQHKIIEQEVNEWIRDNKINVIDVKFQDTPAANDYDPSYNIMVVYEIDYIPTETEFKEYIKENIDEIISEYIDVAKEHLEDKLKP